MGQLAPLRRGEGRNHRGGDDSQGGGLYELSSVYPQLESAWFQTLSL
jgi:hypothetical protein